MRDGRRNFLGQAACGVAALAGLLLPGRVLAWGRRRGGCQPCSPSFPVCEGPLVIGRRPYSERGPVTILYPDETTVPGGGGLFAWGLNDRSVDPSKITATCGSGTVTKITPPPLNTWAFMISGLTTGNSVTLKVYYPDPNTGMPVLGDSFAFTPQ
jgi:hypothetical protein